MKVYSKSVIMVQRCQLKLLSYSFILHKQFYFVGSSLENIDNGNPDNNLESHSTTNI
jgi:hypothetical protein